MRKHAIYLNRPLKLAREIFAKFGHGTLISELSRVVESSCLDQPVDHKEYLLMHPGRNIVAVSAVLLVGFILQVNALEFLSPPELKNVSMISPRNTIVGPSDLKFDVTGQLAVYNLTTDLADKIVVYEGDYPDLVVFIAQYKPIGIIVRSGASPLDIPGISNYIVEFGFFPDVTTPVVQVSPSRWIELDEYVSKGLIVTVRITSDDPNQWEEMMQSGWMIFFSVLLSAFSVTCLALAVYKFVMFAQAKGCIVKGQLSVTQTMLVFEVCGNGLRFIACAVDSMMSRKLLSFLGSQLLFTTHWPFVIINLLLVSFYWHELMSKTKVKINRNLDKFHIPFWVIFAIFMALEWTQSILRGLGFPLGYFLIIVGIFYIVVALGCIIFYYITGSKLQRRLQNSKVEKISGGRVKRLNRASAYIYASSGGVIVWVIGIIVGGLTNAFWVPWGYFAVWFIIFFATTFISLMHLLAVQEPRPCGQSNSSTAMSSQKSTNTMPTHSTTTDG